MWTRAHWGLGPVNWLLAWRLLVYRRGERSGSQFGGDMWPWGPPRWHCWLSRSEFHWRSVATKIPYDAWLTLINQPTPRSRSSKHYALNRGTTIAFVKDFPKYLTNFNSLWAGMLLVWLVKEISWENMFDIIHNIANCAPLWHMHWKQEQKHKKNLRQMLEANKIKVLRKIDGKIKIE